MIPKLRAGLRVIRRAVLPTAHDKVVASWWANGGDAALRYSYDLHEDSLVLDVGGYTGAWAAEIFARYACRITVFEPVPAYSASMRERFRHNKKIAVRSAGLGGESSYSMISVCEDSSSLYTEAADRVRVEIMDVAEWFASEGVTQVDLIKINIEGGEYGLLERLIETRLIESIRFIQVQFHRCGHDPVRRMQGIKARLRETHKPQYEYEFVWESWERKGPA
jgi:FkbM family methyltransferase